jgi:SAM-dependent methyltransferase
MIPLTSPDKCLLCGERSLNSVRSFSGAEVRVLYEATGHKIPQAAFSPMKADSEVILWECADCGFRFFDPGYAGRSAFYEELDGTAYYVTSRPEFQFAIDRLLRHSKVRTVLDVGSGSGAFLDLASKNHFRSIGVELNKTAAEKAEARGHRVYQRNLQDLSEHELKDGVDAVTMFHVLEHVPDPVSFVRDAAKLLRSDGRLIITVPNGAGLFRVCPYDPMNLPPHHISYWRPTDLERVAKAAGLECELVTADPLYGSVMREFWLQHLRLQALLGRNRMIVGPRLASAISWIYRKVGGRHIVPRWGLSLYGVFVKNEALK